MSCRIAQLVGNRAGNPRHDPRDDRGKAVAGDRTPEWLYCGEFVVGGDHESSPWLPSGAAGFGRCYKFK
jgi:hypothetical protein